jgi:hypothetical protein
VEKLKEEVWVREEKEVGAKSGGVWVRVEAKRGGGGGWCG